ncbi:MAG: lysophospholipid acyltransferase family protein [Dehalococcoidia bacterium]|nr:lysophospholipid acyltransferase family protein [Dehalococcoidia bacterium]
MPSVYATGTATMKLLLRALTRWKVVGQENIPRDGPIIIVANHMSMVDPPLLSASIPRQISFMAKEELFTSKRWWLVPAFGAFPVRHGMGDVQTIRRATRMLQKGQVLGIFPEGKRSSTHAMDKAEVGVALIALLSGAPILPVGITGTEKVKGLGVIFRRPRITVTVGPRFYLAKSWGRPSRERLTLETAIIMSHVASVLPSNYHGAYGDYLTYTIERETEVARED